MTTRRAKRLARTGSWICPICYVTFAASAVDPQYPVCPHCDGEGIGSELVPLEDLLRDTAPAEIARWADEWRRAKGFRASYHGEKLKRMRALLALSRRRDR